MGWVYIVTWILVSYVPYTPEPYQDEYGRWSHNNDAVYRVKESEKQFEKKFDSREDALMFIEQAPKEGMYSLQDFCKDFKLDSIKTKGE